MDDTFDLPPSSTSATPDAAKQPSSTDAATLLEVGQYICRSELLELTDGVGEKVTAVKTRMTSTYRSAKFRTQNSHPTRDFKITTSSTPHGDDHVIVTATLMRIL